MEMALRQMQIDEGVSDISMSQQKLNRAQVRATLHQMRGEAMSQGVRTNAFGDTCSPGGRYRHTTPLSE